MRNSKKGRSGSRGEEGAIAIVLISVGASGTERRMAFVFKHLATRYPGRYRLIINRQLYEILQKAGFGLDTLSGVHILEGRSWMDIKRGAHPGWIVNIGRALTLLGYRIEIARIANQNRIGTIQVFLEMVPFLGIFPVPGVKTIASLVSHLPKYYDPRNPNCWLLLLALRRYALIDALYEFIATRLRRLGVNPGKIHYPRRNCVDHDRFCPQRKERIVTFGARAVWFKNPLLMLEVIEDVMQEARDVKFHVMGQGPMQERLGKEVLRRGLQDQVSVGYLYDPSVIVNRSLIHVCIEEYDNATNQSLLEGMAAGCAVVASDVGLTRTVVTPDIGLLVRLDPKEIAGAVLNLLRQPELCSRMGDAARRKILAEHGVEAYADYLVKLHHLQA